MLAIMTMPPLVLLACPVCRGALSETVDSLTCTACARVYPVSDDVPDLRLARSSDPGDSAASLFAHALHTLVAMPVVYDFVQRLAGREALYGRMRAALMDATGALVLDAGAGTGSLASALPSSAGYLWLDPDVRKLDGFRTKSPAQAMLGDATRIPLRDDSVDWGVSVGVSHHLDDDQLGLMLDELRRVVRDRIVFLDAVADSAMTSRLLWRYDRGAHPRPAEDLKRKLATRLELVGEEEFTVRHRYLLVTGRPLPR